MAAVVEKTNNCNASQLLTCWESVAPRLCHTLLELPRPQVISMGKQRDHALSQINIRSFQGLE